MTNRLKVITTVFSVVAISAVLAGLVFVNILYIRNHPVEKKFLIPWLGMRTFLEIGNDPYGDPATQRTQLLFYGKLVESGQDPLILNQPFATEILYFPFALISDYTIARVVWMFLLELLLIGSVYLILYLFELKIPIFMMVAFSILAIFGAQSIIPLLENDKVIFVFIFLLVGLIGLQKGFDELSGAAFALAFFQPSLTSIICLMTFWWAFHNRRKRVIFGAMMAWGFLILTSFGLFPGWFLPFIRSFRSEMVFINYQSTFGILFDLWPAIGLKVAIALTIGIVIILILEWRAAMKKDFHWLLWTASLTLATYPLLGIPTLSVNNIVFLIPLTYILKVFAERIKRKRKWLVVIVIIGFIFLGGWSNTIGLQKFPHVESLKIIAFFAPSLLLVTGLYWIRWWATHPPRTWLDSIDRELS